jgi:uncharacterized DUF497 family protein
MQDEHFEWDDDKAARNAAAHGVSFETARQVFADPFGVELLDDRLDYGEDRWIRIGMAEGTILMVVYTERFAKAADFSSAGNEVGTGRLFPSECGRVKCAR